MIRKLVGKLVFSVFCVLLEFLNLLFYFNEYLVGSFMFLISGWIFVNVLVVVLLLFGLVFIVMV